MGRDLADAFPAAQRTFALADAALGERLSTLCFEGPADALTLTHNAQPALFVHGAAIWAVVGPAIGGRLRAAAGHSLGEFTAWHAVGALGLEDGVRLVRRRGELMYDTGITQPGTMAAILGDPSEPIEQICQRASVDPAGGLVVPANYNSPGQVVISGAVLGVQKAIEFAKAAGAKRAIQLNVTGAFHSPLMAPAREGLAAALAELTLSSAVAPVYANCNASPVSEASQAPKLLIEQLTSPVRWTETVERLARDFPDALFVEMGPGTVLAGLVRKVAPQLRFQLGGTAADVRELLAMVS